MRIASILHPRTLAIGALAALAFAAFSADASAQKLTFTATIDQAQETPPTGSPATGKATFVVDRATKTLSFFITFSGLGSAEVSAHIHQGAPGVPGPILFALPLGSPKIGTWNYPAAQEQNIITGLTYVNIHSANFGGGEIRGQILIESTPTTEFSAKIDQAQETPPTGSTATGAGFFAIDTVAKTLTFNINYSGLSSTEVSAHIHQGAVGVPGPILFSLPLGTTKTGVWNYPAAQESNILTGLTYVNIHSSNFGGGEIRGQILAVTNPQIYCSSKVNSLGCTPAISFTGAPSMAASTLHIGVTQVLNNKNGLLFWSANPAALAFQGGTLCAAAPVKRTAVQQTHGNAPPNDCSGSMDFFWSTAELNNALLAPGKTVYNQYWSRDPSSPSTTSLSDAVQFVVQP